MAKTLGHFLGPISVALNSLLRRKSEVLHITINTYNIYLYIDRYSLVLAEGRFI